jgi:hypothetical protein
MRGRGEDTGRNINIPYLDVLRVLFCSFGSLTDEDRLGFDHDAEFVFDCLLDEIF